MRAGLLFFLAWALAWSASAQQSPPSGGTHVDFATVLWQGGTETLKGMLWRAEPSGRGAVVLVHGSGGWSDVREGHYARALHAAGYTVLAIDAFGPRGVSGTSEDQSRVATLQMTLDAFAARRHLVGLGADPERTAVMGFSKGGQVALFAADRTFAPAESARFQVAVAVYPGCNARVRQPKPASALFMLLGEKDDYTGVAPCQTIASDFGQAGGRVQVTTYPNATHAFDGDPRWTVSYRLPTVENYIRCVADVEPDGSLVYGGKRFEPGDMAIVTEMRATCVKKGATMWTNLEQKQRATQDVIAFLNAAFPAR